MIERTRRVAYLNDGELVVISRQPGGFASYEIKTLDNVRLCREVQQLEMTLQEVQKGEYRHFMLKEICEQPEVLANAMRGLPGRVRPSRSPLCALPVRRCSRTRCAAASTSRAPTSTSAASRP